MLAMNVSWTITLNTSQLNTALRALRGALREDEVEDAQQLANSIAHDRVRITKEKLNEITKLERNLKE